ncbi:hypothetical protein EIN_200330 [Entamoeba invadens IP1]|uniref:Uncharacterized protein n=1 Tax=Entamoeba invadens IP1 TaxID=370355 RepID=L7FP00_ENTIV|nr:hypothetical protein EIN_200330 [Entamoeba invadens IP1]ELP93686.1 hypothetical protein EIN_200330 [Entamoeba invadens IP1]|eukprot:XP_004260457.1 hypothetical protein EIN_200330 [Entamoeba invadens IP1]
MIIHNFLSKSSSVKQNIDNAVEAIEKFRLDIMQHTHLSENNLNQKSQEYYDKEMVSLKNLAAKSCRMSIISDEYTLYRNSWYVFYVLFVIDDMTIINRLFDLVVYNNKASGDKLATLIKKVLNDGGIYMIKLSASVTDGGSNCMGKNMGTRMKYENGQETFN